MISAQAEPLVRPYYGGSDDAQVNGVISGIIGAAAYERATRANLASTYWDAFNVGLIVAIAAILIGGLVQLITYLLARRKDESREIA